MTATSTSAEQPPKAPNSVFTGVGGTLDQEATARAAEPALGTDLPKAGAFSNDEEIGPPRLLWLASEGRALIEYAWYLQATVWLRTLPKGDGHPVLVLPGFTTGDSSTGALRRFLRHRGYKSYGWLQGLNLGLRPQLEVRMIRRLREIYYRHGRKVTIIGWSLGGVYARELARQHPDFVRQVITLGSPINQSPRANHAWRLYERLSQEKVANQIERMALLAAPLEVPSSAVYSRTDGIVSWQCCLQHEAKESENIEVYGSHCGLGHNPMVMYVIADRLAQAEGQWRPFDRKGLRRLFFKERSAKPASKPKKAASGQSPLLRSVPSFSS